MAVDDDNKDAQREDVRDAADSGDAAQPAGAARHAARTPSSRAPIADASQRDYHRRARSPRLPSSLCSPPSSFYRSGRVDTILREQIVSTLAEYGIRAEVEGFETQLGARTAEIRGTRALRRRDGRGTRKYQTHHGAHSASKTSTL
jgi:hypothetical protein